MARERLGHTLQPTALVNEVYLRLVNVEKLAKTWLLRELDRTAGSAGP
jgi:hypothetical protein